MQENNNVEVINSDVQTSVSETYNDAQIIVHESDSHSDEFTRRLDADDLKKMSEEKSEIQANIDKLLSNVKTKKRTRKSKAKKNVEVTNDDVQTSVESQEIVEVTNVQETAAAVVENVQTNVETEKSVAETSEEVNARLFVKTHVNNVAFTNKRPGVIACIVDALSDESQPKTKKQLMSLLIERFPERQPEQMKNTLMMQCPSGLKIEKRIVVATTIDKQSGERAYYIDKRATYLLQSEYDARKNAQKS